MKTKQCTKCYEIKSLDEFSKEKRVKSGYQACCKECHKKYYKPRHIKLRICGVCGKKFKPTNNCQKYCSEKCYIFNRNKYSKKWREEWEEKNPDYYKKRYKDNKEHINETSKKWQQRNPDKCKKYTKKYYLKNYPKIQKQHNEYMNLRRKEDINFRIAGNYRNRMRLAIKQNWKSGHTLELLNCSIEYLKKYLEKLFKKGMTWDNYGVYWHIDHIRPCSSFDLSKKEEQYKCFNYTNLQPLWAKENLVKSNKY